MVCQEHRPAHQHGTGICQCDRPQLSISGPRTAGHGAVALQRLAKSGPPRIAAPGPRIAAEHSTLAQRTTRSEEHTSELQSLMRISYAVFCLKKKKKTNTKNIHTNKNKTIVH